MYARTYTQSYPSRNIPFRIPENYHGEYLREDGRTENTQTAPVPEKEVQKTEHGGLLSDLGKKLTGAEPADGDADADAVFLLVLALLLFSDRKEGGDDFAWVLLFLLLLG